MTIVDFVSGSAIVRRLAGTSIEQAIDELAAAIASSHALEQSLVRDALLEREHLGSTALGHGIAVPHARLDVPRTVGALGLSPDGIDFAALDGLPVRILVALISPLEGSVHLKALATVARELSDEAFRTALLAAKDSAEIHRLLVR